MAVSGYNKGQHRSGEDGIVIMDVTILTGRLEQAEREIAALTEDKLRLEREVAKLRSLLRARPQDAMSSRLKDALRE
ncbi:hypothetical protein [Paenibacillus nasutitermitis]|uniref:Uncharacterized protein n=1 Tax=Paenibacillus nasutitermitis TaxID=1652958 RepID=A0A917E1Y2_9BACL|nr:hypothetical protein [Paenibacillus nasutitermitis]GGD94428.1 hypothetical protein GCM10010911_61370 [Paenibacillus nasutitermitis]